MKKIVSLVLAVIMSITIFVPVFANGEISVYLDNEKVIFDVDPIIANDRTLVPMRAIFEKIGATVNWNSDTRTAFAQKGDISVSITIDDTTLYKNNTPIILDVPAQLNGGRTLVPLRAVSEAFDCDVQWDGATQTVNIYSNENGTTINIGNQTEDLVLTSEEISQKCSPAVFYIEVYGFNGELSGSGSGFFITSNGVAITNFHVVSNSSYIKIITSDGKVYENISIIDYDEENDLALLRVDGANFPFIVTGDSSHLKQGQHVYAIGSPLGLSNTMSQGIISNTSRMLNDVEYIQISVPINHGSSGGALIDDYGRVIGITSAGFETTGDLNLAIPINKTKVLDTSSTSDYVIWSDTYYPGFAQVLDFGAFSGVQLISSSESRISCTHEYDMFDFYPIGTQDGGTRYAQTTAFYEKLLEDNGMTKNIISDTEMEFESEYEYVSIKYDYDTGKIIISTFIKPIVYDEYPMLIDFGWYSNIPMEDEPYQTNDGLMYFYKWIDYYTKSDFDNILYSYFDVLQSIGFKYIKESQKSDYIIYWFERNNLYIAFDYTKTEVVVDVMNK